MGEYAPNVHKSYEDSACYSLAPVWGRLSTCAELMATRRLFLGFLLRNQFERCIQAAAARTTRWITTRSRPMNWLVDESQAIAQQDMPLIASHALPP